MGIFNRKSLNGAAKVMLGDGFAVAPLSIGLACRDTKPVEKYTDYWTIYQKISIVQQCINYVAGFAIRKGYIIVSDSESARDEILQFNSDVNIDEFIHTNIIKRDVYGRAAWQIKKSRTSPWELIELQHRLIKPFVNQVTFVTEYYTYQYAKGGKIPTDQVFYWPRYPRPQYKVGMSAIEPVIGAVNTKRNLERDILEASKRMWAPMAIFQVDTSAYLTEEDKKSALTNFQSQLQPGRSIVVNQSIEGKPIDLHVDMNGLIRALEKSDEEISGNWGMPKALLSREKTLNRATLDTSLKALYEGPVATVQKQIKREIEKQLYIPYLKQRGYKDVKVELVWNPAATDEPEFVKAILKGIADGVLTKEEGFNLLGWIYTPQEESDPEENDPEENEPEENEPPKNEPPKSE